MSTMLETTTQPLLRIEAASRIFRMGEVKLPARPSSEITEAMHVKTIEDK